VCRCCSCLGLTMTASMWLGLDTTCLSSSSLISLLPDDCLHSDICMSAQPGYCLVSKEQVGQVAGTSAGSIRPPQVEPLRVWASRKGLVVH
jgi:hypothetical protein